MSDTNLHTTADGNAMPNTTGTMKSYNITLRTNQKNETNEAWKSTFIMKAAKYSSNSYRYATITQKNDPIYGFYSGKFGEFDFTMYGGKAYKNQTSNYNVFLWNMPATNCSGFNEELDYINVDMETLKKAALNNGVIITMNNGTIGDFKVSIDGKWTSYAHVTLQDNGNIIIEPYGYPHQFKCKFEKS